MMAVPGAADGPAIPAFGGAGIGEHDGQRLATAVDAGACDRGVSGRRNGVHHRISWCISARAPESFNSRARLSRDDAIASTCDGGSTSTSSPNTRPDTL